MYVVDIEETIKNNRLIYICKFSLMQIAGNLHLFSFFNSFQIHGRTF